jgi:hypothetical protein
MKVPNFLKKTIAGVPIWFLLSVAIVLGAVYTVSQTISITAKEPFTSYIIEPTKFELYPGEEGTVQLKITNEAPVEYGIVVDITPTITGPCIWQGYDSVDGIVITAYSPSQGKFNIGTGEGYINYTLSLPTDVEAGTECSVELSYSITRGPLFS